MTVVNCKYDPVVADADAKKAEVTRERFHAWRTRSVPQKHECSQNVSLDWTIAFAKRDGTRCVFQIRPCAASNVGVEQYDTVAPVLGYRHGLVIVRDGLSASQCRECRPFCGPHSLHRFTAQQINGVSNGA